MLTSLGTLSPAALFAALVIGHCLGDYPLQGDFLAKAKNHRQPIPGVPWYQALTAHAAIQAGIVWAITGSAAAGVAEFAWHWVIDYAKSEIVSLHAAVNRDNFNLDQLAHVLCKLAWVLLLVNYRGSL